MKRPLISRMIRAGFLSLLLFAQAYAQTDPSTALGAGPLPSWNDGPAKKAIPAQGLANTKVGTFTQKLFDEAKKKGWSVISMKNDWKRVFAFE